MAKGGVRKGTPIEMGMIEGRHAILLDGPEGVFGVVNDGELVRLYSGDDGSWNEIAVYHRYWIEPIIACLRRSLNG